MNYLNGVKDYFWHIIFQKFTFEDFHQNHKTKYYKIHLEILELKKIISQNLNYFDCSSARQIPFRETFKKTEKNNKIKNKQDLQLNTQHHTCIFLENILKTGDSFFTVLKKSHPLKIVYSPVYSLIPSYFYTLINGR